MGLLGMDAFLSPISYRQDSSLHDLISVPNAEQLLIKGRTATKPLEARLKDQRGSSRLGDGPPKTQHTP